MKARVKATGEIVEVKIIDQLSEEEMYVEKFGEMSGRVFHITELDFDNLDNPDYWTRLEHQYAGMIVQGMVEHNGINFLNDAILNVAVQKAHALVGKMKGERK
jgi:hypothetical protein